MQYVIKNTTTGLYRKGKYDWTANLQKARVFGRTCDARNSVNGHYTYVEENYEVLPVTLLVSE